MSRDDTGDHPVLPSKPPGDPRDSETRRRRFDPAALLKPALFSGEKVRSGEKLGSGDGAETHEILGEGGGAVAVRWYEEAVEHCEHLRRAKHAELL